MSSLERVQFALAERYQVQRELGRGGMATVYLAHDSRQDRPVALKVIHPELVASLGPERFLREIKLTAKLRHPHILPLFDSGETAQGQLWYTMPYIEGESLRQRLLRRLSLPLDEAVRITCDVLAALDHAHAQGVVHRDIKPENILLEGNEAILADFGIAHAISAAGSERLTRTGMVVGTVPYLSPEQATGHGEVDQRSDIYSMGCVLYEMVVGEPPFTGSPQSIMAQHLTATPRPIRVAGGPVPTPLVRAVAKALAKHPEERFPTAAAFARALAPPAERLGTPAGARRIVAAALIALTALAATFYVGRRISTDSADAGASIATGLNRKLSQLTFGEGLEEWPAWSPDGRRLVYAAEINGFRQLMLLTLTTGNPRQLTREPTDHVQPSWSPDGRVAFVRASAARSKLEPNEINGWFPEGGNVWSLDPVTGVESRLVDDAFNPVYSPDGQRIAFDARWAGARRIWVADASGRNPRQVTSDSSEAVVHTTPRWSPDGSKLAYRRIEGIKSDIVVLDSASQVSSRLTDDNVLDMDPVWAPDGASVFFTSDRGGGLNLWRVSLGRGGGAGPQPEQLTTGAGADVAPSIAPDGNRLVFAVRGVNSDLWRLPVSPATGERMGAADPVVITSRVESRGAWSPDGRTLAFNSDRLGEMNIWLHGGDGADRQLTRGPGGDYQPTWAPDGHAIVFFSARAGNADIWSVALTDGRLTRLTEDPAGDTNPFYSPDGRQIAFISDRGGRAEVWVMGADGSQSRQLTSIGAGGHFLRWSPDGRSIAFRAETGTQVQVYQVSVADGGLTQLPDIASGAHMSFSPTRSLVLDVRGHNSLWVHPLNGQPARQIFAFAGSDIRIDYPTWSPDGRWIVFDRAASKGGDLWLLEMAR
jgi:eukaryotic-like serine/threonine-protein kinase